MFQAEPKIEISDFNSLDPSNEVVNGFTGLIGIESRIAVPVDITQQEQEFTFGEFPDETWGLVRPDELLEIHINGENTGWFVTLELQFQYRINA